jgi:hypothetical protein
MGYNGASSSDVETAAYAAEMEHTRRGVEQGLIAHNGPTHEIQAGIDDEASLQASKKALRTTNIARRDADNPLILKGHSSENTINQIMTVSKFHPLKKVKASPNVKAHLEELYCGWRWRNALGGTCVQRTPEKTTGAFMEPLGSMSSNASIY